jgi:hypothetical protein
MEVQGAGSPAGEPRLITRSCSIRVPQASSMCLPRSKACPGSRRQWRIIPPDLRHGSMSVAWCGWARSRCSQLPLSPTGATTDTNAPDGSLTKNGPSRTRTRPPSTRAGKWQGTVPGVSNETCTALETEALTSGWGHHPSKIGPKKTGSGEPVFPEEVTGLSNDHRRSHQCHSQCPSAWLCCNQPRCNHLSRYAPRGGGPGSRQSSVRRRTCRSDR